MQNANGELLAASARTSRRCRPHCS